MSESVNTKLPTDYVTDKVYLSQASQCQCKTDTISLSPWYKLAFHSDALCHITHKHTFLERPFITHQGLSISNNAKLYKHNH